MTGRYLERILTARVYDVAHETPLSPAPELSRRLGCRVLLKREDLQPVFSFKLRGAYNRMVRLDPEQAARGVVAASAGNHAQGVALAAQRLGIRATIVMPRTTPTIKVEAVRRLGARILLRGDTYDEAAAHATALAEGEGMAFIHPYDDPDVIAGQGTIGMEILRQHPEPIDAIFVPVGGGGLIAGIAAYVKHLRPEIRIVGVEPEDAPSLTRALERGRRVRLPQVGIFADGVAVRQVGREPFRIARSTVDEMVLVSVDEICAAIKDIFDDTRSIAEPAGAVALAGLKRWAHERGGCEGTLVAIESGANINFGRLRYVAERTDLGEGHEALFAVTIPERPGSFLRFCRVIGRRAITEFNYRYADASEAHVFVGLRIAERRERAELMARLREEGYAVVDLSDDEVAKLHIRHMVGGRAPGVRDELLYRVQFPERPGALLEFLSRMGGRWNISLFHYRNHGDAYGRVLMGVQVPPGERRAFRAFLTTLGFPFWDESANPAYALFAAAG